MTCHSDSPNLPTGSRLIWCNRIILYNSWAEIMCKLLKSNVLMFMFPKIKLPGSMTRTNVRFDVFFAAKNFWMEQILQSLLIKSVIALVKQLQPFKLVYLSFVVFCCFFHPVFSFKINKAMLKFTNCTIVPDTGLVAGHFNFNSSWTIQVGWNLCYVLNSILKHHRYVFSLC